MDFHGSEPTMAFGGHISGADKMCQRNWHKNLPPD